MSDKKKPNVETRVGRGKVRNAHYGKDQFGRKMSIKDRTKLLKSGAKDLVDGMKKAQTTDSNN